ncbi:hypothetical protein BU23DRAFT_84076 [Bimuria novae-zelandiae CBS 107.79]|uniref:DUF7703 domain-containing protein n=1 Tax=Bimuria novae-zelandiae CBS 107.79 TaxID=1447943 RepID=A0A6A5USC8_9PLEO|nr:hypothetical protein BU23DRAFT_84076 [Bimuria novae-zelandiae CBS 107.79]
MASSILQSSATSGSTFSVISTPAPPQGSFDSPAAGVTGGYTGDSIEPKIMIAFLIGLSLYNAVELIILILFTFNKYSGLYFWSLTVSSAGIIPYSLGFLIKFFQILDPNQSVGYIAVVMLSLGWYSMVTGQSVVLWSRLHLLTSSQRVIRWSLYMICTDVVILQFPTSVLTFGSNANTLSERTLHHFVRGYNIMEKIQMVGFFVQELILSLIYIKETLRIIKLSKSAQGDIMSIADETELKHPFARKVMYQLLAINSVIIAMDVALLAVEFANLYLIETTLKGVVYSIKLKLEFAVLGKLVQIVRSKADSSGQASDERQATSTGLELEKLSTARSGSGTGSAKGNARRGSALARAQTFPDFVDPARVSGDVTHAVASAPPPARATMGLSLTPEEEQEQENAWEVEGQHRKRWYRANRNSWIDEEMDKHNIG